MKRVLLTGMSGTGKSTLIGEIAARGYKAVDADSDAWSEWIPVDGAADPFDPPADSDSDWHNRDWIWREDRMERLLSTEDTDGLFVGGTASNQGKFHAQFDHIVLLTAPVDVLMDRLATRTTNSYGKHPEEVARVLRHIEAVEPLLRRAASMEIDTSAPIDCALNRLLSLVEP